MRMKKRYHFAIVLVLLLVFAAAPVQTHALPECHYDHNTFTGEDLYEPGSLEASYVDYIQACWKCDTTLSRYGALCGYWSNQVRAFVSASERRTDYYGLRFNKTNFLKVCKGVKPGTKLVLGQAKWEDGSLSHAIVLLKVTSKEVWWADCNWNHDNVVHYRHGTIRDFINFYHYRSYKYSYLHFVVKINKYRYYSKPQIAASNTATDGTARIVWTKTPKAKKYLVYRASSADGKFKRIDTVKACSYSDSKARLGKKYYYKVAAVDKKGKKKWSSVVTAKTRLDRPHTSLKYPKGKTRGRLVWDAVPGADKYIVYRKYDGGTWYKAGTTKKTEYSDSSIVRGGKYWYKIKAVSKNSKRSASPFSPWITTMDYACVP